VRKTGELVSILLDIPREGLPGIRPKKGISNTPPETSKHVHHLLYQVRIYIYIYVRYVSLLFYSIKIRNGVNRPSPHQGLQHPPRKRVPLYCMKRPSGNTTKIDQSFPLKHSLLILTPQQRLIHPKSEDGILDDYPCIHMSSKLLRLVCSHQLQYQLIPIAQGQTRGHLGPAILESSRKRSG